jgi:hypothetical protein
MRKPTTGHGRKAVPEQTPPGGRALERVKQDRLARRLPSPRAPGSLILTDDTAAATTGSKSGGKAARTTRRA